MEVASYRAVRDLFDRVVDLPAPEQAEALAEVDPPLREAVLRLLLADASPICLEAAAVAPPTWIGPYRILRELGRGAAGVVYEAEEAEPRRRVAIKVLHPWLRTPERIAMLRREAAALATVVHPGIPAIHALIELGGAPVLIMERVDGEPITRAAAHLGRRARGALLLRVVEVLSVAHGRGVVHRDLKPANILVTAEGQPKVVDFGIARIGADLLVDRSGTPAYMPPEQRRGEPALPSSDVYALAVVSAEVLLGRLPDAVDDPTTSEEDRHHALVVALRPLREDLRAVLSRSIATDPRARYPDAAALAEDLRRWLADRPVAALPGPGPRARAFARRHPLATTALLALALLFTRPAALLDRLDELRAEARLEVLRADPRGFDHVEVRARLDNLAADPAVFATPARAEALGILAGQLEGHTQLVALTGAWIFSGDQDGGPRQALQRALLQAGRGDTAAALGTPPDPRLQDELAAARLDLDNIEGGAQARFARALAPTTGPRELVNHRRSLTNGVVDAVGSTLRAGEHAWTLPSPVAGLRAEGEHFVAWGDAWIASGSAGSAHLARVALEGPPADSTFADLDGDGVGEVVVAMAHGGAGLYRLDPLGLTSLHAGTSAQGLPLRSVLQTDLDGDGAPDVVAGGTGWKGHELRVYGGAPLEVLSRMKLGVWAAAMSDAGLYVIGGPAPTEVQARSDRRWLLRVGNQGGRLHADEPLVLPVDAVALAAADVDGDGRDEQIVTTLDGLGVVEAGEALWLPGLRLLEVVQADGDPGEELWVADRAHSFLLGAGDSRLPPREPPALARSLTPPDLPRPSLDLAWGRAALLSAAGAADLAVTAFFEICRAGHFRADQVAAALAQLDGGPQLAELALRLAPFVAGPELEGLVHPILRAGHAFDVMGGPPLPEVLLRFDRPLPEAVSVGAPGTVRRNPMAATLSLDLLADDPPALSLPLLVEGGAVCADLELVVKEVDWSAGLELTLGHGATSTTLRFWRVGGGARGGQQLSLSFPDARLGQRVPLVEGPHAVSVCVSAEATSLKLDHLDREVLVRATAMEAPWSLAISPVRGDGAATVRVRVDLLRLRLRGAVLAAGVVGPALPRRYAEGVAEAVAEVASTGSLRERALAVPSGLPVADRRALLRREPLRWLRIWQGHAGDVALVADLVAAWDGPLTYGDPSATSMLLDPALDSLPTVGGAGARLALARAQALFDAGEIAPAESLLQQLRPEVAEADFLLALLDVRRGRPEASRASLERWRRRALSAEAAADRIAAEPDLAALGAE